MTTKMARAIERLQQVKAEHQVLSGLLQPVMIPEWKWDRVMMDFVSGLPLTPKKKDVVWVFVDRLTKLAHFILMALYEALYGGKCQTPLYWTEHSEKQIHGVDLVRETEEKVKIGDKVFLNVSPWKKIVRFRCKGKLSSRFITPYEIIERIGPVAYRLALPPELVKIHNVFHVSILCRYRSDPSHVISPAEIEIQPDMTYNEELIGILAQQVKELRNKCIDLVKVLW
ncbi:reverse transcriptase [Gossypium australe]|uniref:Reverse transcriptase n=1 Tax=Gossypium australe TaxID=47621 RepID=A0A5B6U0C2_9ROSI|nr:reverse transcriptase [Gossypium australe]